MPLTNPAAKADVYVALEEEAIRCVVDTMMLQRPSLFNYATQGFIDQPALLYQYPIPAHPAVQSRNQKEITVLKSGLPVFGTRLLEQMNQPPGNGNQQPKLPEFYSLNFFGQVTTAQVDFSPGNVITMPQGLPALPDQHFALHLGFAAGVGFPPAEMDMTQPPQSDVLPVLLPIDSVCKFPMEVVITGYATRLAENSAKPVSVGIDGFEIIDLQPAGMECLIESYVKMEIGSVIIPQLITYLQKTLPGLIVRIALPDKSSSGIHLPEAVKVTLTPTSEAIPRNPSFQNDAIETNVYLVEVVP